MENPHPTRVIRVFGTMDQSLSVKVKTLYETRGGACGIRSDNLIAGWIEGVATPRLIWGGSKVERTGDHYEAHVAIDRFADKCGWYPRFIGFQISNQENLTTGEFSPRFGHIAGPENIVGITTPRFVAGVHEVVIPEAQTIECRRRREGGESGLKCKNKAHGFTIPADVQEIQVDVYDLSKDPIQRP